MPSASSLYPTGGVFTVDILARARKPRYDYGPNEQAYDVGVVEFEDDGTAVDGAQLEAVSACIRNAREKNPNGAVVVLFIHGWHHGARWDIAGDGASAGGDTHFGEFRSVLQSLALREAERYSPSGAAGRRVVGIYVGWNGDPRDSRRGKGWLSHFSFRDRYHVASTIGGGAALRELVRTVVARCKEEATTPDGRAAPESPLVLIGHSMGALILESAFLALLENEPQTLVRERREQAVRTVEIERDGQPVTFPDVLIALNSAADSTIASRMNAKLKQLKMTKTASAAGIRYAPPLVVSVTSNTDSATGVLWRIANGHRFWHKTDGHDSSLFTHGFATDGAPVTCQQKGQVDFGQNWHCLRKPEPLAAASPNIAIDLPVRDRRDAADSPPHARYVLAPRGRQEDAHVLWVFQVPPEIIKDHNDIFNSRASSLILALIQVSGAVMSLAEDWANTFE